ncbi:MAG: peptidylprolyl isomerase [Ktedonobacterales bacterium]|nr:peptidylprolyl isomerase [Ktedonobacterales bacterium]
MTARKSSGLVGAFREEAIDFFKPEANVVAQSDERQLPEPCLFSDPGFGNSETLGQFWRVEKPGQPSPLDGQPSQLSLIQGGSVAKNGQDGASTPGYSIQDEKVIGSYTPGTIAMAKTSQPNSAGAQFFIDIGDESKYFSPTYQIFGHVTSGLDVASKIAPDDLMNGVTITVK